MSHPIEGVKPWPALEAAALQADEEQDSDPVLHAVMEEVVRLRADLLSLADAVVTLSNEETPINADLRRVLAVVGRLA